MVGLGFDKRFILSLLFLGPGLLAAGFTGKFALAVGRDLSPEASNPSVSFEPDLGVSFSKTRIGFYTLIDRPTDPFESMLVPKTILSLKHDVQAGEFLLSPTLSTNFVALNRWQADGYQVRQTASMIGARVLGPVTLMLRAGVFGVLSEYTTLPDGKAASRYGFVQRGDVEYKYRRLFAKFQMVTEQRFNGEWANDYVTVEALGYQFSDNGSIAIQHELLSSVIDSSTGFSRPLRIVDGRDSRVSIVLELGL